MLPKGNKWKIDLINLPHSASKFSKEDLKVLNVIFRSASNENEVIPIVEGKNYVVLIILLAAYTYNLSIA